MKQFHCFYSNHPGKTENLRAQGLMRRRARGLPNAPSSGSFDFTAAGNLKFKPLL